MERIILLCLLLINIYFHPLTGQQQLLVEGSGAFTTSSGTTVDIINTDDNTNALIRFGDNNSVKSAFGFNGNDDAFKMSMATTLGSDDLTISETGLMGINTLPSVHQVLILHNSTSGTSGSEHLTLKENNNVDFARIHFDNLGAAPFFSIDANSAEGSAKMNLVYNDGISSTDIMTLDGGQFQVGIHQTAPEAYLHMGQPNAGIDQIVFENDDAGGSDRVDWRVGSDDMLIYFNQGLRAAFDAADGSLNNFPVPPPPLIRDNSSDNTSTLKRMNQLSPLIFRTDQTGGTMLGFDPDQVMKVHPEWIIHSEDKTKRAVNFQQLSSAIIQSILEQQKVIQENQEKLMDLKMKRNELKNKLSLLEAGIHHIMN